MSDLEDRLRAELRAEAQRTQPQHLRDLHVPAGRARTRRGGARRWLAPAAALLAVGLVATVIGVVAGGQLDSGPASSSPAATASPAGSLLSPSVIPSSPPPPPPSTAPAAAPRPPFYVEVTSFSPTLTVRDSTTGAVLGQVSVPGGQLPGLVTAAADDRTFVISAQRYLQPPTPGAPTSFYQLTVSASGRPGPLRRLPLTIQPGSAHIFASGLALSADGSTLAVASSDGSGDAARRPVVGGAAIDVVSLKTGETRTWTGPGSTEVESLSWGQGDDLGFLEASAHDGAVPDYQLRILATEDPAGRLLSASTPVALAGNRPLQSALLTDGGRFVIAWALAPGAEKTAAAMLAEFSARTGRRLRVLDVLAPGGGLLTGGTVWSADPSGQHLLIGGEPVVTAATPNPVPVFARLDNGLFDLISPLPGSSNATTFQSGAW